MYALLDTLAGPSERFALGRPRNTPPTPSSEPSTARPFGLRFGTASQPVADLELAGWRLCPDRQTAITSDRSAPVVDMTMNTTGETGDGSSGGGAEEWGPDHHDDEGVPA